LHKFAIKKSKYREDVDILPPFLARQPAQVTSPFFATTPFLLMPMAPSVH
jgi:hypothetical protein